MICFLVGVEHYWHDLCSAFNSGFAWMPLVLRLLVYIRMVSLQIRLRRCYGQCQESDSSDTFNTPDAFSCPAQAGLLPVPEARFAWVFSYLQDRSCLCFYRYKQPTYSPPVSVPAALFARGRQLRCSSNSNSALTARRITHRQLPAIYCIYLIDTYCTAHCRISVTIASALHGLTRLCESVTLEGGQYTKFVH